VTTSGLAVPPLLAVALPALQRAAYPVIAEPPSLAGAPKEMVAVVSPALATTAVGAPGDVAAGATLLLLPPPHAASGAISSGMNSR
jgi:hypothetical protein